MRSPKVLTFIFGFFFSVHVSGGEPGSRALSARPSVRPPLTEGERDQLLKALDSWNSQYDPAQQMLLRPFSSPGYHTTLKGGQVHPTRDSLNYAVALLDTGLAESQKRAEEILRKVISLQDQDSSSKTYGIWSWFLEEPLSQMSPPDWNWADFCGVQLLQVALFHRDRLPRDLAKRLDEAIRHAARAIQRRDVGPGYTNIAIMGTYVTLIAAELYALEDLREYALSRLRRFHAYTLEQGAFTEYNSPTYTVVALQELGRLKLHARTPEARQLADDIYRLAWLEIAQHFHPPTRQWAGPHSRCYRTLLPDKTLALIQHATDGRVRFFGKAPPLGPEEFFLPLPCPRDLEHYFAELSAPRELVKTFVKGKSPVIGTTWLAPEFAVGSVNRGDLWNQRRSLVAYWGAPQKPSYLHLRFLHDGYDFADAQFFSLQRRGVVLGGVVLATDGGDTHVSLDRITNGTVKAGDLRLRFEFGGASGTREPLRPDTFKAPAILPLGGAYLSLEVPFAAFGTETICWDSGQDPSKNTSWLDVVFYRGDVREFRLGDLEHATVAFCAAFSAAEEGSPALSTRRLGSVLELRIASPEVLLRLPLKPAPVAELQQR